MRVGTGYEAEATRGDDRFRASLTTSSTQVEDVFVDYDVVPPAFDFTDDHPVPSDEEIRDRLPEQVAGFDNAVGQSEQDGDEYRASASVRLPQLGGGTFSAELTARRGLEYVVTEDDVLHARRGGVPVYGVEVTDDASSTGMSGRLVAYIPEDALPAEDAEAAAAAMIMQDLDAEAEMAATNASFATTSVGPASVAGAVIGVAEFVMAVEGVHSAWDAHFDDNKYVKLDRLASRARVCAPELLPRIDTAHTKLLVHDGFAIGFNVLGFGVLGIAPPVGLALGGLGYGVDKWFDYLNDFTLKEIERELHLRGCKPERRRPDGRPTWIFDPSGYVYEGLEHKRLEGVTATIVHGDEVGGPFTVWDAEWFGQSNPQSTNAEGRYGWDVPEGYWQVLWEAEGYEPASSAVLRVLPPHLDVNAGLRRLTPPDVQGATATGGGPRRSSSPSTR